MTIAVLVPRRSDGGHRDRLWEFARAWWLRQHPDWPIFEGESPIGPFNRAAAINDAARKAGDWTVALIIDSDIIANPDAVAEIVEVAEATDRFCVSHTRRVMLDEQMTERILDGYVGPWEQRRQRVWTDSCSCCVAVSRTLFDKLGGFDEKFIGWGFEDSAFALLATVESGPIYYAPSTLFHLWHPESPEADHKSSTWHQNRARLRMVERQVEHLGEVGIPRILHRTVPEQTSDEVEGWWRRWGELHPDWDLRTYRDPIDASLFPTTSTLWGKCQNGAQKAGLIRLEALWTWGGVYVDSDVEPFRSLEPLVPLEAFAAWEDESTVPDAVLGARPNHPAFKRMLDDACRAVKAGRDAWVSGPGVTTKHLPGRSDVTLLPPGAFYPYHYLAKSERPTVSAKSTPWAFGVHHWHHSWGTDEQKASIDARQRSKSVAVVIPWRSGCEHRERAHDWVLAQLADKFPDWEVVHGESPDGPFNRSAAILDGASKTDADVLVCLDGDVWCDNLREAVTNVTTWAVPHRLLHRLSEASSAKFMSGHPLDGLELDKSNSRDRRPYVGNAGGTLVVLTREAMVQAPPDPRFVGWGQEDEAWALALTRLVGKPWRGKADLVHIWHPPQERQSRAIGSPEGAALLARYRQADSPEAMRALLAEATVAA